MTPRDRAGLLVRIPTIIGRPRCRARRNSLPFRRWISALALRTEKSPGGFVGDDASQFRGDPFKDFIPIVTAGLPE